MKITNFLEEHGNHFEPNASENINNMTCVTEKAQNGLTVEQFISGKSCHELKRYDQFSHSNILDRTISLAVEFESF